MSQIRGDGGDAPRVSVLMPLLNPHPAYFPQAVASVLGQTLRDLELVIVEDPSENSGGRLLEAFPDPRIRHVLNPRRTSLAQQRNRTLELARADLVAFLDADDVAEPDRMEKQLRFLQDNPDVDVLGTDLCIIDGRGAVRGYRTYPRDHTAIVQAMRRFNPIGQPSLLCRKSAILDAGGFSPDYRWALDYDLWCRLAVRGARFANMREPLVRYRIHPQGSKSAQLRRTLQETIDIKEKHWGKERGLRFRARAAAERMLYLLPPALVLRLFMLSHYRPRPAASRHGERLG